MAYRLNYSDYVTSEGPPDPSEWVGPPGPVGPVGPQGAPGVGVPYGVINGTDYGIVADGVTDDTAALAAAIAAAQATVAGGQCFKLMLPKGRILTSPQIITNQIYIQGTHDNSTVLVLKTGSTTACLTINPSGTAFPGGTPRGHIVLQDLRIESQSGKTGSATAHGISFASGGAWTCHVTLQRVTVYAMPGHGINASVFDGWCDAYDCSIFNNALNGVNAGTCNDWHWYGGDIAVNGQIGALLSGCSQFVIQGTNVYSNGTHNLYLFSSPGSNTGEHKFTDVMFDSGNQMGVLSDMRGLHGAKFKGCTFGGNSKSPVNTYSDVVIGSAANNLMMFSGCAWNNNYATDPAHSEKWALEFLGTTQSVTLDGLNTFWGGTLRVNSPAQVYWADPGSGANVKDYGAIGNGVANDTAAINAAIAAASVQQSTSYWNPQLSNVVSFPPGLYMTDGIDLPCGISLTGAGQLQTTIALRAGANRSVVRVLEDPQTNPLPWLNRNHGRISGITVDGNSSNQTGTSHGIEVVASSYTLATRYGSAVDIDDINTVGTRSSGIYIGTNRNYGMITNVRIAYAGGTGLQFFSCYDWYCTNIGVGNSQQEGVKAYLCAGLQFTNLAVWSNQNAGLVLNSCGGFMVFENVQLDYNSQYGLYHNPAGTVNSHLSISNLQVKDNGVAANNTYSAIYIGGIGGAGSSVLLANVWFNWTANSPNRSKYLIETDATGYISVSNIRYSTTAGTTEGCAPYATAAFNHPERLIGDNGLTAGALTFGTPVRMNGTVGFNNTAPIAKPTVSGAKGGNAALASLLTALASYGLITDSTGA